MMEALPHGSPGCPSEKSLPGDRRQSAGAEGAHELFGCGTTIRFIEDVITHRAERNLGRKHIRISPHPQSCCDRVVGRSSLLDRWARGLRFRLDFAQLR